MALFETIRERLGTAGQITTDIAKRTAEMIRLREQIRQDKKEIRKLTYEIGQTYLRLHADDYEEVYKEYIDGITVAKSDIEEKLSALAQLKEKADVVDGDITTVDDDEWDDLFEDEAVEEVKGTVESVEEEPVIEEEAEAVLEEVAEEAVEAEIPEQVD